MGGRGALHTMPMLVINMGGEMVYILEQRLTAQNVAKDKASRVLQDVVSTPRRGPPAHHRTSAPSPRPLRASAEAETLFPTRQCAAR